MEWKNRHGDIYTFTPQEDGSILWEGKFEYCRVMHPTVYEKAYQQYRKDGGNMHIDTFREKIHEFRYKNGECIGLAEIGKKYYHLIYSDDKTISGIDPSGGPYIKVHQELDWLGEEFKDLCVSTITSTETGYRIGTYGKYDHLADLETIGGIINRTKN
jgi:hypothetical protein